MPIQINGNGTITGYDPVPNGSITSAKLASGVGGKILQVIQHLDTNDYSTTGSSYVQGPQTPTFTLSNSSN